MTKRRHTREIDYGASDEHQERSTTTFAIILVALLFAAVLGGALVGGVVSGEPSNTFLISIISASMVAIAIAVCVALRYCVQQQRAGLKLRQTFSSTDEENNFDDDRYEEEHEQDRYEERFVHPSATRTPVDRRVKEIRAGNRYPGDLSALSPNTYDVESLSTRQEGSETVSYDGGLNSQSVRRGHFEFASVASSRASTQPRRADPPVDYGPASYSIEQQTSRDPTAAKVTPEGVFEAATVASSAQSVAHSTTSGTTKYDVELQTDSDGNTVVEEVSITETPEPTEGKTKREEEVPAVEPKRGRSRTPRRKRQGKKVSYHGLSAIGISIDLTLPKLS